MILTHVGDIPTLTFISVDPVLFGASVVSENSCILRMLFYASLLGFVLVLALGVSPSQSSFRLAHSTRLVHDFSLVSLPWNSPPSHSRACQIFLSQVEPLHPSFDIFPAGQCWFNLAGFRHRSQPARWWLKSWIGRPRYTGGAQNYEPRTRQVWLSFHGKVSYLPAIISFDQARLIRHNQILARNGIDPSGMFITLYCLSLWTMFSRHAFGLKSGHPTVKISELGYPFARHPIIYWSPYWLSFLRCNLSHDRFDYRCPYIKFIWLLTTPYLLRPWCCTGSFQKPLLNPLIIRSDPDYHDATAGSNQGLDPFSLLSLLERPGFTAGISFSLYALHKTLFLGH